MKAKIYTTEITEQYSRKNFEILRDLVNGSPFFKGGFQFRELSIPTTGTGLKFAHNLGFLPKDVILMSVIGGTITFNYNRFDSENLDFDATVSSSPMTVRALFGTYTEE